ncbi:MAG: oleate hydratase [Faecalimonas sp.]
MLPFLDEYLLAATSMTRTIHCAGQPCNSGEDAHTDGKFNLSQKGCMEIMKLFMTKDEDLYDKTIEDVFDEEVFRFHILVILENDVCF